MYHWPAAGTARSDGRKKGRLSVLLECPPRYAKEDYQRSVSARVNESKAIMSKPRNERFHALYRSSFPAPSRKQSKRPGNGSEEHR
jgi:hypothetical protein